MDYEALVKEVESTFSFYRKGDMKKLTKFLKSKGMDIVNIRHNPNYNGWGVAVTTVSFWDEDGCNYIEFSWG